MISLLKEFERKNKLVKALKDRLREEEADAAERDSHSYRIPRPCGLTIHTGLGCKFGCIYCYIYDMGFSKLPRPYALTGLQLAYAIAVNPSVAIGLNGTLMAFGSVTEPFMEETMERSLEYLEAVSRILGNPIQFSTKTSLTENVVRRLGMIQEGLSALITIVTLSLHRILEPGAPDPSKRYESMSRLVEAGIHTCLFLRPIFPGISDREFEEILKKASDIGARGVVLGSMRVTIGILRRLQSAGYPKIEEVLRRAPRRVKSGRQVTLKMMDLKRRLSRMAEEIGLKIYPSACSANIEAHGLSCNACKLGPCGDPAKLPDFDPSEIRELSRHYNLTLESSDMKGDHLFLRLRGSRRKAREFSEFIKAIVKRRIGMKVSES